MENRGKTSPRGKVWSRASRHGVGPLASWGTCPCPGCFNASGKQEACHPVPPQQPWAAEVLGSPTLAVWRKRTQGRALLESMKGSWVLFPGCLNLFWQARRRHAVSPATGPSPRQGDPGRLPNARTHRHPLGRERGLRTQQETTGGRWELAEHAYWRILSSPCGPIHWRPGPAYGVEAAHGLASAAGELLSA